MNQLVQILMTLLLSGLAVAITAAVVPGFRVRGGFGSAMLIGGVYGLLKALLQGLLIVLSLPVVLLTLGLFIFAINMFLLWLTDKLVSRFQVDGLVPLALGTLVLSVIDIAFQIVLHRGVF